MLKINNLAFFIVRLEDTERTTINATLAM
jgi:hypothetical protein